MALSREAEMPISDFQAANWLSDLDQIYLGLSFDNPEIAGAYASEVFGGSYTRLLCPMSQPTDRTIWNLNQLVFTGLPTVTLTHLVAWDALVNGNYIASAELATTDDSGGLTLTPTKIQLGQSFSVPQTSFAISIG